MNLVVNGEATVLPAGTTVRQLVSTLVASERGVAVSVDRVVVPRSAWDEALEEGASVEVLAAAAGG